MYQYQVGIAISLQFLLKIVWITSMRDIDIGSHRLGFSPRKLEDMLNGASPGIYHRGHWQQYQEELL